jgi:tetratricopeptide (TPR) repeat protein
MNCPKDFDSSTSEEKNKIRSRSKMIFLYQALAVVTFYFTITLSHAQSTSYFDSLDQARTQLYQGDFLKSLLILNRLETSFPGEENMIRVKGQALYWSKDFGKMKAFFQEKITSYPTLQWIKLDFGRILFEMNEIQESQKILNLFLSDQPEHPEANQLMAAMNYWNGGNPRKSYQYLDKIQTPYPENPAANQLKSEIQEATAPYLSGKAEYTTDTQPLNFFRFTNSGSTYQNTFIQPGYSLDIRSYDIGTSVFLGQIWNKTTLPTTGTSIVLRAGLANSSEWINSALTYGVKLTQPIGKLLEFSGSIDKEAYFYTLASQQEQVLPLTYRIELGREKGDSWTGKALISRSEFEDANWVQSISFWAMYPVFKVSKFRLDAGYAFNSSDSKEVRFEANRPILNRQNTTLSGDIIPGAYTPYFTPINQQIHAGLAKVQVQLSDKVKIQFSGNVGVKAQIDNPNTVYYGVPGNGAAPIKESDIFLELYPTQYTPYELTSELNWRINPKTNFMIQYAYQQTIFFENTSIGAGVNLRIWND